MTEQRFGFIHDKIDTKMLILYVLHRLPARINAEKLADLVLIDGGIGYFDYKQCLYELIEKSNVDETEEGCLITAKGSRNCEILADSLPYSVRMKADKVTAPVAEKMRREAMILANHEKCEGGVTVYLALSDGIGNIFDLKILAASEEQAEKIERSFRKKAEDYYNRFISELLED